MSHSEQRSMWFIRPEPRADADLRLMCIPHAGGSAAFYHGWQDLLPASVEVITVVMPGHDHRRNEPSASSIESLVDELVQAIQDDIAGPIAIFGHSLGGLIAYETAIALEGQTNRRIEHLFVSGRRAPQLPLLGQKIHRLPQEEFIKEIEHYYGKLPKELSDDQQLLDYFLPVLRADLGLLENYVFSQSRPLNCPVTVFGGTADRSVSLADLEAWRELCDGTFEVKLIHGDHFFLRDANPSLMDDLRFRLGSSF